MRLFVVTLSILWLVSLCLCKAYAEPVGDLTTLSIEELMQLQVITASKKPQAVWDVPAAVYVISGEDIQRAGANSIPEALRLVPGVHVATIDASKWAVAVRGFNGRYSNKLLVLIDGRSVYTPFFSGVYWDAQPPLFLNEVERIEVVRGPGAALWGANAVNGVINIITRSAKDTQGTLVVTGGGLEERAFGGVRVGGQLGANAYYRIYTLYYQRDRLKQDEADTFNYDDWRVRRGGFRVDWYPSSTESLTLQGEAYSGRAGQRLRLPAFDIGNYRLVDDRYTLSGYYLMGSWRYQNNRTENTLNLQIDHYSRSPIEITENRDTLRAEWRQRIRRLPKHDILWGVEYTYTRDRTQGRYMRVSPDSKTDQIIGFFVQDDIQLNEQGILTLGSKVEHNSYTAWEIQPNMRLLWKYNPNTVLWAAVSRAVRMPTRAERTIAIDAYYEGTTQEGIPLFSRIYGSNGFQSEQVVAYELGGRFHPSHEVSLDLSAFYNIYRNLRSFEPANPFLETSPAPHIIIPVYMSNKLHGHTYGFELATNWQVNSSWSLKFGYANITYRLKHAPDSRDPFKLHSDSTSNTPRHQWNLVSHLKLPSGWYADAYLFFADRLVGMDFIPAYYRLDLSLGWRAKQNLEFHLYLQNLLRRKKREFEHPLWERDSVPERTVYGRLLWRY